MNVILIASIVEIILYSIIVITILYYIIKHFSILHFTNNFYKYKDQPTGAMASTIAGKNPREVFESSFTNKIKPIFNKFLSFLTPVFAGFSKILSSFGVNINSIRNVLQPIRTFFAKATTMFYTRLNNFMIGITYILQKLRIIMQKTLGGFYMVVNTMEHIRYMFMSISNSPLIPVAEKLGGSVSWIGKTMRKLGLCFHPNTLVQTKNGHVPINNLALGDQLENGNIVESIIITKMIDPYYNYKGILVTGTHLVQENNNWLRVEDSKLKIETNEISKYQYCLITSNHTIPVFNGLETIVFRDYIENIDPETNTKIRQIILESLNNKPNNNLYENFNWKHGFLPKTNIKLSNGLEIPIRDIKIGDLLENNNEVLSIIYHLPQNHRIFNINNIKCSENTLVYDQEWKPVNETNYPWEYLHTPLINLVTENETIKISGFSFRDFLENHSQEVCSLVNNILLGV
jgi:hypothetical protein